MNRGLLTIVGLMALTFLRAEGSGCDSTLVGDPTMDLWCGKTLCAWTVDKGKVQRVTTWHRSDYGVGLVGDEVTLSQLSSQSLHDTDCLEFRLQADHDDGVNLLIEMDLFNNKTVEFSQPLGSDKFVPSIFHLKPPMTAQHVRFIVRKSGSGAATLAEVKIKKVGNDACAGVQPIALRDLAEGSPCTTDNQCKGHSCAKVTQWPLWYDVNREVCASCTPGGTCPSGQVCGVAWGDPSSYLHRACVARGVKLLGERCGDNEECAGGICCSSVCSSCCVGSGAVACTSGSCSTLPWSQLGKDFQYTPRPHQCSPGAGLLAASASCLRDADCASSSCKGSGPLRVCLMDGRTCKEDNDCPFDGAKCLDLGQAGGLCQ
jgi:hypothetical protein